MILIITHSTPTHNPFSTVAEGLERRKVSLIFGPVGGGALNPILWMFLEIPDWAFLNDPRAGRESSLCQLKRPLAGKKPLAGTSPHRRLIKSFCKRGFGGGRGGPGAGKKWLAGPPPGWAGPPPALCKALIPETKSLTPCDVQSAGTQQRNPVGAPPWVRRRGRGSAGSGRGTGSPAGKARGTAGDAGGGQIIANF